MKEIDGKAPGPEAFNEMHGRLILLEGLVGATITHIAAHTDRPDAFIKQIMADTEEMLDQASKSATAIADLSALNCARAAFHRLSRAMLAHLTRYAPPAGSG